MQRGPMSADEARDQLIRSKNNDALDDAVANRPDATTVMMQNLRQKKNIEVLKLSIEHANEEVFLESC